MKVKVAETKRTLIDRICVDDASFFVLLVNTPDWLRYIGDRNVADETDARRFLEEGFFKSYRENGFGYYLIRDKPSRDPIGICGFLKKPDLANPDFGFALLPEYYNRGLAFEASQAILEFGIQRFSFNVLDAVTCKENTRSMRLLQKLGFEREGSVDGDDANDLVLFRWHNNRRVELS